MITKTKNILKISNNQVFLQDSVKKRRTREELANLTKEERSLIYDHKSPQAKLRKTKRIVKDLISNRKRISLYMLITVPPVRKRERSNVYYFNYIYKKNSNTKKITISKKGTEYMSNEQRWASVVINTNNLFRNEELEPDYVSKMSHNAYYATRNTEKNEKNVLNTTQNHNTIQTEQKNYQQREAKSSVPSHKTWVPEKRPEETPEQAFLNMTKGDFLNSPEWAAFEKLMGKEDAMKWFKAGMFQATRPWD